MGHRNARGVVEATDITSKQWTFIAAGKDKLQTYFVDPLDEVYESVKFPRCLLKPGKSVASFLTVLRFLVKNCLHSSIGVDHRLVRDQFVVGLLDKKLDTNAYCGEGKTLGTHL